MPDIREQIRINKFERRYKADGSFADWVELSSRTAMSETGQIMASTWHPIRHLRPRPGDTNELRALHQGAVWSVVGPAYDAWQAGQELPQHGTPLAAWPGLNDAQREVLASAGLRTVEDVASFAVGVNRMPLPGMADIVAAAKKWLDARPVAEMVGEIDDLKAQLAAALEMLAEREEPDAEPKRRGRPPKAKAEDVEAA